MSLLDKLALLWCGGLRVQSGLQPYPPPGLKNPAARVKCGVRSSAYRVPCGKFADHDGPHEAFFGNGSICWDEETT